MSLSSASVFAKDVPRGSSVKVRPTVGGIGVGGSRVLGSEAETPPLAGPVCVWGKPVLVLDVQGPRLRRDVRAWHAGEAGI